MRLDSIHIRDPFVLPVPEEGKYYLFGSTDENIWDGPATGFDTYWSSDLEHWHGPISAFRPTPEFWSHTQYWAPEVHRFGNAYFMFATFTAPGKRRGTAVLRSDGPAGPYLPWSHGPVTPESWECLDGTLWVEDNVPYLVFCREWKDVGDGEICVAPLSPDLRTRAGAPRVLFRASEADWARSISRPEFPLVYVTDGPSLYRSASGALVMLWSSFGDSGYAMGTATSENGSIAGPWLQSETAIWPEDGGHGMIFRDFRDQLWLTLHTPNRTPDERAHFEPLTEGEGGALRRALT